ncbi:HK97 family phage prohead protease [Pseudooceanicola sp.]|uniref:HK97 family phage prohead protease n=1 Tax=Pseudooceanicola sp. TaxID=1914328 RepID=UPI0035152B5F
MIQDETGLERKFARFGDDLALSGEVVIEGYASLFGQPDQGGDIVQPGAYAASLAALAAVGRKVKMLWQHDPAQPIGVWDAVAEDARGLRVKGRLLDITQKGREAAALIAAGALDGLSIGYRTRRAERDQKGQRLLTELELWEVSVVTFPMLPAARVAAKAETPWPELGALAAAFDGARRDLARRDGRLSRSGERISG